MNVGTKKWRRLSLLVAALCLCLVGGIPGALICWRRSHFHERPTILGALIAVLLLLVIALLVYFCGWHAMRTKHWQNGRTNSKVRFWDYVLCRLLPRVEENENNLDRSEWKETIRFIQGVLLAILFRSSSLFTGVPYVYVRYGLSLALGVTVTILSSLQLSHTLKTPRSGDRVLVLLAVAISSIWFLAWLDSMSGERLDLQVEAAKTAAASSIEGHLASDVEAIGVTISNLGAPLSSLQDLYVTVEYPNSGKDLLVHRLGVVPVLPGGGKHFRVYRGPDLPIMPYKDAEVVFSISHDDCGRDNNYSKPAIPVSAKPVGLGIHVQGDSEESWTELVLGDYTRISVAVEPSACEFWIKAVHPADLEIPAGSLFYEVEGIRWQAQPAGPEKAWIRLPQKSPTQSSLRSFRIVYIQGKIPLSFGVALSGEDTDASN